MRSGEAFLCVCQRASADFHVVHGDPALVGAAPLGGAEGELCVDLNGIALVIGADDIVAGARAAADVDVAAGNGAGACALAGGAVDVDVIQADPPVLGAAPGGVADLDLLQNVYTGHAGIVGHGVVVGARAAADVQSGAGDDALGGVGAGGAVLVDVVQADPTLIGAAPAVAGLQNGDPVAVGVGTLLRGIRRSAFTDVQLGSGDNALGAAGGCGVVCGRIAGVAGIGICAGIAAEAYVVQADPALIGTAPAVAGLQNCNPVAIDILSSGCRVFAGTLADVQLSSGNDALLAAGGDVCHVQIVGLHPAFLGDVSPGQAGGGNVLHPVDLHFIAGIQGVQRIGRGAGRGQSAGLFFDDCHIGLGGLSRGFGRRLGGGLGRRQILPDWVRWTHPSRDRNLS